MPKSKLTDLSLPKLTVGMHWDTLLPAFGVRVQKTRRTFLVVQKGGHRVSLGHYGPITLAQARERARALMLAGEYRPGSFKEVLDAYISHTQKSRKESHSYEIERLLRKHFPIQKPIAAVTKADLAKLIDQIDGRIVTNRATTAIKAFFNWAEHKGYIQANPAAKLKKPYSEKERDRVVTDHELKAIWNATSELGNYGVVVKLICLLALRKSEPLLPKTINDKTVTFLDTKNGYSHTLPITPYAKELIQKVQYTNGWSKNFERLKEKSGCTDFTLHDLRRSAASRFNCDPWLTERILGHRPPKLQRIYNHQDFTEAMRKPLEDHQEWLLKLTAS